MNKLKTMLLSIVVVLTILFLFTAFGQNNGVFSNAIAKDTYKKIPTPTAYPTSVPQFTLQKIKKYTTSHVAVRYVNGVEMSASNFRVEGSEFMVDVCFQLPDNNDWVYHKSAVDLHGRELVPYGGVTFERVSTLPNGERYFETFLGDPPVHEIQNIPIDGTPDYRCDTLKFRLDDVTDVPTTATLTIYAVGGSPREGQECAAYETIQSLLDSERSGIKIGCEKSENGRSQRKILEKPTSMSNEEAERRISKAFKKAFVIEGPWVFEGSVTVIDNP